MSATYTVTVTAPSTGDSIVLGAQYRLDVTITPAMPTRVETYVLRTATGRKIRKATRVLLPDGRVVSFTERLSRRKALHQAAQRIAEVV